MPNLPLYQCPRCSLNLLSCNCEPILSDTVIDIPRYIFSINNDIVEGVRPATPEDLFDTPKDIEPKEPRYTTCHICRNTRKALNDNEREIWDWVCNSCINKSHCSHCYKWTEDIVSVENISGHWSSLCGNCFFVMLRLDAHIDSYILRNCASCEFWVFDDELKTHRNLDYHNNCFWEDYFMCDACSRISVRDSANYSENDDCYYCESCYDNHSQRDLQFPNRINKDIYKSKKFKNTGHIKRCFGIELECYNKEEVNTPCEIGFEVVEDGSLHENGQEFRTGIFQGDLGLRLLNRQCNKLNRNGFEIDKSCGLHVHIDANDLTPEQLLNITSFMLVFEHFIYRMLPKSRLNGSYSMPLQLSKTDLDYNKNQIKFRHFEKDHLDGVNRYRGFNLNAVAKHGTIEFRYHSGTINYEKIQQWVNLCLRIVQYQKDIFWDRSRKLNVNSKRAWKLFYSTLQLNENQIAYWESRKEKFSPANQQLCEVGEEN